MESAVERKRIKRDCPHFSINIDLFHVSGNENTCRVVFVPLSFMHIYVAMECIAYYFRLMYFSSILDTAQPCDNVVKNAPADLLCGYFETMYVISMVYVHSLLPLWRICFPSHQNSVAVRFQ